MNISPDFQTRPYFGTGAQATNNPEAQKPTESLEAARRNLESDNVQTRREALKTLLKSEQVADKEKVQIISKALRHEDPETVAIALQGVEALKDTAEWRWHSTHVRHLLTEVWKHKPFQRYVQRSSGVQSYIPVHDSAKGRSLIGIIPFFGPITEVQLRTPKAYQPAVEKLQRWVEKHS